MRLWSSSFRANSDLAAADRTYVARLVAAQTGLSQPDAEKRVNDVIIEAKAAADRARSGAAKLAFWMTAALIFGAFAASLAAVEGGQLVTGPGKTTAAFRVLGKENRYADPVLAFGHSDPHHHPACSAFALTKRKSTFIRTLE